MFLRRITNLPSREVAGSWVARMTELGEVAEYKDSIFFIKNPLNMWVKNEMYVGLQ